MAALERYFLFEMVSFSHACVCVCVCVCVVVQVEGLVGRLERLLRGARVSQVVGRSAVRAISNLMEGDNLAISSSSTRYNTYSTYTWPHLANR